MVASCRFFCLILLFAAGGALFVHAQPSSVPVRVPIQMGLDSLLWKEDTDGDTRITIDDPHLHGTARGNKQFWLPTTTAQRYEIAGTYYLSNLLQELTLEKEAHRDTALLLPERIFEPPVQHISRSIRELYWDGLTRSVDEKGLPKILQDEKARTVDGFHYVYVPHADTPAFSYFSRVAERHRDWNMKVVSLPHEITPDDVRRLDGHHGILSLSLVPDSAGVLHGEPFVVPGGRFNEMYGWDSYFIALGLLQDGRVAMARSMVDNFIYEITNYGSILNANRTYYLTRSQPPFFTSMASAVYERLPKTEKSKAWLGKVLAAAFKEYYGVWMNQDRLTPIGLSRYYDFGKGVPPEVEPGHFDILFSRYARRYKMSKKAFEAAYRSGKLKVPELDRYFVHDRSMRESGHDTSYRLEERSADLATVDLNSLLYKYEMDIATILRDEFSGSFRPPDGKQEQSSEWFARAEKRKGLINRYQWDEGQGMFFDYNYVAGKQTGYVSATTFYPLWAKLASAEQAARLVQNALPLLETPGGIAGSAEVSRGKITPDHPLRQWDYPFGWAPHQILAWVGMRNYHDDSIAERLAYRWLFTITLNAANYNGTVPEKFDVVNRTHQVFAEYGNVGTKFSYITREGFGWTNTSYELGRTFIPQQLQSMLNMLIPPEWIFRP